MNQHTRHLPTHAEARPTRPTSRGNGSRSLLQVRFYSQELGDEVCIELSRRMYRSLLTDATRRGTAVEILLAELALAVMRTKEATGG